jgi:hypothetical protein
MEGIGNVLLNHFRIWIREKVMKSIKKLNRKFSHEPYIPTKSENEENYQDCRAM